MSTSSIGFGPNKGPDLDPIPGAAPADHTHPSGITALEEGVALPGPRARVNFTGDQIRVVDDGTTYQISVTPGVTSTHGAGLPTVTTRSPGDFHFNTTDNKQYVVVGTVGGTAATSDNFNRANNATDSGTPSDGGSPWTTHGPGVWAINNNAHQYKSGQYGGSVSAFYGPLIGRTLDNWQNQQIDLTYRYYAVGPTIDYGSYPMVAAVVGMSSDGHDGIVFTWNPINGSLRVVRYIGGRFGNRYDSGGGVTATLVDANSPPVDIRVMFNKTSGLCQVWSNGTQIYSATLATSVQYENRYGWSSGSGESTASLNVRDVIRLDNVEGTYAVAETRRWAVVVPSATAATTSYAGSTNLAATNVEAALDELDAEKAPSGHTHPYADVVVTQGSALPTPTARKNHDLHYNTTDGNLYIHQGVGGSGLFTDSFDRANSNVSGSNGWSGSTLWQIVNNRARQTGTSGATVVRNVGGTTQTVGSDHYIGDAFSGMVYGIDSTGRYGYQLRLSPDHRTNWSVAAITPTTLTTVASGTNAPLVSQGALRSLEVHWSGSTGRHKIVIGGVVVAEFTDTTFTGYTYAGLWDGGGTNLKGEHDNYYAGDLGTLKWQNTDAGTASVAAASVAYAGSTNLSATNVEAALDELDAEKAAADHTHGTGGSAHTIEDEGVALTQRAVLNFVGAGVTVSDDATAGETVVSIPGGGSGASFAPIITLGAAINYLSLGSTTDVRTDIIVTADFVVPASGKVRVEGGVFVRPAFTSAADLYFNVHSSTDAGVTWTAHLIRLGEWPFQGGSADNARTYVPFDGIISLAAGSTQRLALSYKVTSGTWNYDGESRGAVNGATKFVVSEA